MPWEGNPRTTTPHWRATRKRILTRDNHRCYLCGAPATDVDHIDGDHTNNADNNLAAICGGPGSCHAHKSSAEGHSARWRTRSQRTPETHPGLR